MATSAAGATLFLASLWIALQGGVWLSSVERLPGLTYLVITRLLLVAALWLAALGLGWPLRWGLVPTARRGLAVQLAAGLAALLLLAWMLALAGLLGTNGSWTLLAVGWALLVAQMASPANRALWSAIPWPDLPWTVVLAGPAVGLLIVACAIPPGLLWPVEAWGYDVMSYHLQIPREWLALGRMEGLPHNVYSYLPSLMEAGYMLVGALHGSMYDAIYTAQFFHASLALAAAITLGCLVERWAGKTAGAAAAAVMLAVPWTIITGSLAYDEMGMMAAGAGALLVAFDPVGRSWRGGALVGFLAGAATLAKLPAGPMIALPIALAMLLNLNVQESDTIIESPKAVRQREPAAPSSRWPSVLAALIAGLLTLSPYLIRNAIWTGNPVFPFAADALGRGHWTPVEVQRWQSGHAPAGRFNERLTELGRHWLCNAGYGAVEAAPRPRVGSDWRNVASFPVEWGFPVLWSAAGLGALAGLSWRRRRKATGAMLLMLVCQVAFWLLGTHLQSRFLIPSLLPGSLLVGLGLGWLMHRSAALRRTGHLAAGVMVGLLTLTSLAIFFQQTPRVPQVGPLLPWMMTDSLQRSEDFEHLRLEETLVGDHAINHLPAESKVLLLADVSRLLYIRRPMIYNSAFDPNPLGRIIRQSGGDAQAVNAALRRMGLTHVWINLSEYERLRSTYGFDADITPARLQELAGTWKIVFSTPPENPVALLYALP